MSNSILLSQERKLQHRSHLTDYIKGKFRHSLIILMNQKGTDTN